MTVIPRIVLAGSLAEFDAWCDRRSEIGPFAPLVNGNQPTPFAYLTSRCTNGRWWITRLDCWQHDQSVVDALLVLREQPGVELIDPTGLLGGSRYGSERNANDGESAPVGLRAIRRVRSPSEPPAPKARHGLRRKT